MNTLELYVKHTSNCEGFPLTSFTVLSDTWTGGKIILPFGERGEKRLAVVGWTDLMYGNPYPDVVRGCPDRVSVVKVEQSGVVGYLVYGGNSGVRIGGKHGWGQPFVWIETPEDLPLSVRHSVEG